jgi:hypothetical protein
MHELYELKEKLCRELKKYSNEEVTTGSLDVIDKLSHAIKNMDKIIEKYEEEENGSYGYNSYEGPYRNNRSGRGSYNNSYGRGRGRNARRDNMGRYSNEGYSRSNDDVAKLREKMMDAPTDEIRRDYERVIASLESHM